MQRYWCFLQSSVRRASRHQWLEVFSLLAINRLDQVYTKLLLTEIHAQLHSQIFKSVHFLHQPEMKLACRIHHFFFHAASLLSNYLSGKVFASFLVSYA